MQRPTPSGRRWAGVYAVALLAVPSLSAAQERGDDFELGAFQPTFWSNWADAGLAVSMGAAHRGSWGLLMTQNGPLVPASATATVTGASTRCALRFWMNGFAANGNGTFTVADIIAKGTGVYSVGEVMMGLDAGAPYLALGWYDVTGGSTQHLSGREFFPKRIGWHLVEIEVTGIGTATGQSALWVDGSRVDVSNSENLIGLSASAIRVGIPATYASASYGNLSYDDVRVLEGGLPASTLTASSLDPVPAGVCSPLTLQLNDSNGGLARAPYSFAATVADLVSGVPVFGDAQCVASISAVPFAPGATSGSAWFVAQASDTPAFEVAWPDFLSILALVNVASDGGAVQDGGAGVDGGAARDAGAVYDAGASHDGGPTPDGGSRPDGGGAADAGSMLDGGASASTGLSAALGCAATGGAGVSLAPLLLWGAGAVLKRLRRRR